MLANRVLCSLCSGMGIYPVSSGIYYGFILKAKMYCQLKGALLVRRGHCVQNCNCWFDLCVVVTVFKTVIAGLIPTLNTDVFYYFKYFSAFSPSLIM